MTIAQWIKRALARWHISGIFEAPLRSRLRFVFTGECSFYTKL